MSSQTSTEVTEKISETNPETKTETISETISETTSLKIAKRRPVITSQYISIYEYARVLTDLSLLLYSKQSLSKYLGTVEVNTIIDTNRLAYNLLKRGVFDAVIDRGYETVTFSCLKVNPVYDSMIEDFLSEQDRSMNTSFMHLLKKH